MRSKLVPFVLCTMGVSLLFFAGCRKEKEPEIPASSPESYMKDKAFMKQLEDGRKEREGYMKLRNELAKKMQAKVDALKAKLPKADEAAIKAALEKDPEWNELYKKISDVNTAIEECRQRVTALVGERIRPAKKEISK